MKKKLLIWSVSMLAVMLAVPYLAVRVVPSDVGMMASIVLLFVVNPLCAVITGGIAGTQVRLLWPLPLVLVVLFAIGYWISLGLTATVLLLYGSVYTAVGAVSLAISAMVTAGKKL